jgi:two-component system cell cycle response regulator
MPPRRILVVDDSDLSRTLIRRLLERQGYAVLTAGDGAEGAVTALREHPDAVVTDLEMPVMDGYQLARLLKSDSASSDIPLLILTSHDEASSRFWGLETGADGYLVKDELDTGLVPAVEGLLEAAKERPPVTAAPPKTPLEVLARVSRHLDARLLEAVLVNRILQRGVQAEGLFEASQAVLRSVAEVFDAGLAGLVVAEPEQTLVYLRPGGRIGDEGRERFVAAMLEELEVEGGGGCDVAVIDEPTDGPVAEVRHVELFPLTLRGASGMFALAPRRVFGGDVRQRQLLQELTSHLALVLDNARLAQRLRELSMIDGLTRLLNRRTVHQRLCEELERARRYALPLSLALCDLDHFKQVNDTYGHLAGDAVLVAAAEVLRQHARTADVIGRFGGEEFVLLLPSTDLDHAALAARRLREAIREVPIRLDTGVEVRVTASLGVASLAELGEDPHPDHLLALADERLYAAKAAGRDRVVP